MAIHPHMKEVVFDHFVAKAMGQLPTDITFARLKKIKPRLFQSREYTLELERHGLSEKSVYTLRDTLPEVYSHLEGNFWSMIVDQYWELQKEKES